MMPFTLRLKSGFLPALNRFLTVLVTPLVQSLVVAATGFNHFTGVRVLVGFQGALGTGAKRPLKTYKNPHTGEVVKTRGGNHKTLNEWRDKYGKEAVKSWQEA